MVVVVERKGQEVDEQGERFRTVKESRNKCANACQMRQAGTRDTAVIGEVYVYAIPHRRNVEHDLTPCNADGTDTPRTQSTRLAVFGDTIGAHTPSKYLEQDFVGKSTNRQHVGDIVKRQCRPNRIDPKYVVIIS